MNPDKSLKSLKLEHNKMLELLVVLRQEHTALQGNDVQAFQSAATLKQKLAKEINLLEQQRTKSFNDEHIKRGFEENIEIESDSGQLSTQYINEQWLEFCHTARECQKQNLINAVIIDQNMKSVQSLLNILKGQPLRHNQLYDPSGKSVDNAVQHSLGQV
jgi:flagellar biosynthesis/type III secretory pathway chaperone